MSHPAKISARLQELLSAFHAGATTREETHAGVLDLILERIRCSRVSMWRFDGEGDALSLLCFASKVAGEPLDTSKRRLYPDAYRTYYDTLMKSGIHASSDALADPLLAPLRESYLVPNGIVALLDVAFLLNNRAYGRVCCEVTGRPRAWPASDVFALRAIVNKLALLMWSAPSPVLPKMPSLAVRAAPAPAAPAAAPERRQP